MKNINGCLQFTDPVSILYVISEQVYHNPVLIHISKQFAKIPTVNEGLNFHKLALITQCPVKIAAG